jgi:hypothetical protein
VKPDADTVLTVPDDPPAAGPDRALDPPPRAAPAPPPACPDAAAEDLAVDGDDDAVAEGDVEQADSPTTAPVTAAATAHLLFRFDSNRGRDAALDAGRAGTLSSGCIGWESFIAGLL